MLTQTAKKHIVDALRSRLRISASAAAEIVSNRPIVSLLDNQSVDMRNCFFTVSEQKGFGTYALLHVVDANGVATENESLSLFPEHLARWRAMPKSEANALPEGVRLAS
jgi:hypothetical protein